jgi:hypothetical protein
MSILARDDMVVLGGLAAATIACVIAMAAQAMARSRVIGAGVAISEKNGGHGTWTISKRSNCFIAIMTPPTRAGWTTSTTYSQKIS